MIIIQGLGRWRGKIKQPLENSREQSEIVPGWIWKPLAGDQKRGQRCNVLSNTLELKHTLPNKSFTIVLDHGSPGHCKTNISAGMCQEWENRPASSLWTNTLNGLVWEIGLGPSLGPSLLSPPECVLWGEVA